jgi:hypothetical protein
MEGTYSNKPLPTACQKTTNGIHITKTYRAKALDAAWFRNWQFPTRSCKMSLFSDASPIAERFDFFWGAVIGVFCVEEEVKTSLMTPITSYLATFIFFLFCRHICSLWGKCPPSIMRAISLLVRPYCDNCGPHFVWVQTQSCDWWTMKYLTRSWAVTRSTASQDTDNWQVMICASAKDYPSNDCHTLSHGYSQDYRS